MSVALIATITSLIGKVIDRAVPDKAQAEQLKHSVNTQVLSLAGEELKGAVSVITAEASGESWLQRNWRPLVMVWFAILIGAHWLGFTPKNLDQDQVIGLLEIVKVGLGGYVVGRSAEKVMKAYKHRS